MAQKKITPPKSIPSKPNKMILNVDGRTKELKSFFAYTIAQVEGGWTAVRLSVKGTEITKVQGTKLDTQQITIIRMGELMRDDLKGKVREKLAWQD